MGAQLQINYNKIVNGWIAAATSLSTAEFQRWPRPPQVEHRIFPDPPHPRHLTFTIMPWHSRIESMYSPEPVHVAQTTSPLVSQSLHLGLFNIARPMAGKPTGLSIFSSATTLSGESKDSSLLIVLFGFFPGQFSLADGLLGRAPLVQLLMESVDERCWDESLEPLNKMAVEPPRAAMCAADMFSSSPFSSRAPSASWESAKAWPPQHN